MSRCPERERAKAKTRSMQKKNRRNPYSAKLNMYTREENRTHMGIATEEKGKGEGKAVV